jgi:predicted HTH transcriptional regulator
MREIDRILQKIEEHIKQGTYQELETERIELKDLSSGENWNELYKSISALLNTEGGMIVIGVREKGKQYHFTGYNADNEPKLKQISQAFTDKEGKPLDLVEFFPSIELKNFLSGRVCLIFVEKLPEEQKFAFYKRKAYERKLTGDHEITKLKIDSQELLKEEIKHAQELKPWPHSNLNDLEIDRLNDYIIRLNRDIKVESLKADVPSALPFLTRKGFVKGQQPTLLGMLVCGINVQDTLAGRCEVDCFVDASMQIAQNKQILKDNIIPLMESAIGFVFKNIAVGVSSDAGGTSMPEYPEKLIREVVNNALAHRDYNSDKFVNLIIRPNESIQLRNPGSFRADQKFSIDFPIKVRRIIPNPKPRNPRLADVLKVYDRWEGRGLGMASLTNACLNNEIDVPYFIFQGTNDISLYVPKGKVLDSDMEHWLESLSGWIQRRTRGRELSAGEKTVLAYFYKSELLNRNERYTILLTPDNNHFAAISNLEHYGFIKRLPNLDDFVHPIYTVNEELTKEDYYEELRGIFGGSFDGLSKDYKDVLNTIYLFNTYSAKSTVNAKEIGNYIFTRRQKKITDFRQFDAFLRKVRSIVNQLEKKVYITRAEERKPQYLVNRNFVRTPSRFDAD